MSEATTTKTVDSTLYWDSFQLLLSELENVPDTKDLPPKLAEKVKENRGWFLETVNCFKKPNEISKEALKAQKVKIGSHDVNVQSELRDAALRISGILCLDEMQSYILVKRYAEEVSVPVHFVGEEFIQMVLLQYYMERQCLLKCVRQILFHSLYAELDSNTDSVIKSETQRFISDGLEQNYLSILQHIMSCNYPENLDVDLFTLWAEEMLIEANLILDTLFCAYYESLCKITCQKWITFCSLYKGVLSGTYNLERLAVSTEAVCCIGYAKFQLLLILIETLNVETLLQMLHDERPFRQDLLSFSLTDIQEMNNLISSVSVYDVKEVGPLYLTWAVFLSLISSLPGIKDTDQLDIDHVGYVRQSIEVDSLTYFRESLESDMLRNSDGLVAGYRSVMRTLISAFIASYEINLELEDNTLQLILNILCNIYRGEESLCNQFWDRNSIVDGPVRCLLCNLEGEFPFRIVELVRLLSSLSEGSWPADCVYNFLDKTVGVSTLFEIKNAASGDIISQIVETRSPLDVPGIEGLCVPSNTRGHILKIIDGNKALVRWEYAQSGVFVLVMRLAQQMYAENVEEIFSILDLLCRLTIFNEGVSYALLNIGKPMHIQTTFMDVHAENDAWCHMDFVEIICNINSSLPLNISSVRLMALSINILTKLMKCSPAHVCATALKTSIFDIFKNGMHASEFHGSSRDPWLLSGKLAKMLIFESEQNDNLCALTISVMDFTLQLLEVGVGSEVPHFLVIFSLQYVFLNHGHWKYKVKHVRWAVTLKALEIIKKCLVLTPTTQTKKISEAIKDLLLSDSSIHKTLIQIICICPETLENMYISRLSNIAEIEGYECAVSSVLAIIAIILSDYSEELSSKYLVFCQLLLSSSVKPVPVTTAAVSLLSYFRNTAIQVAAAKVLRVLFSIADYSPHYLHGNSCFEFDEKQITMFRHSVNNILWKETVCSEALFISAIRALTSAACYQPAFLVSMLSANDSDETYSNDSSNCKRSLIAGFLQYIEKSYHILNSNPRTLLIILNFLRELWRGAVQFTGILQSFKKPTKFWKHLSTCLSPVSLGKEDQHANVDALVAYKYQCQCVVMEIMACEVFQQKKLLEAQKLKLSFESSTKTNIEHSTAMKDVFSSLPDSLTFGNLIKSVASCDIKHPIYARAQLASSLFFVHAMAHLECGDSGSLAVALIEKIRAMQTKLCSHPSFHDLIAQYSKHRYSEGKELRYLIFCDLYHHLQGELEGRKISPGPFKELSSFLIDSKFWLSYQLHTNDEDTLLNVKYVPLVDTERLEAHLGLDLWDQSTWKASKSIAEQLLSNLQEVNITVLEAASRISTLKACQSILAIHKEICTKNMEPATGLISEEVAISCIDHICQCFRGILDSVDLVVGAQPDILDILGSLIEMVLVLIRYAKLRPMDCDMLIKTCTTGLKLFNDLKFAGPERVKRLLLMLVLSSVEFSCQNSSFAIDSNAISDEQFVEVCNACLPLLSVLCKRIESADICILSLATMDIVLRQFVNSKAWFPILKKELLLPQVMNVLFDKNSPDSVPVILNFLLTLARTRGGTEMLLTIGFFSSFRTLFGDLSDGKPFTFIRVEKSLSKSFDMLKQPYSIWGFGMAVLTASICSFKDASSASQFDLLENAIYNLFSEKLYIIINSLQVPDFPSDDHDKKRARAQKMPVSLACLRDTEQTLLLMCSLVKHWPSWSKVMKDVDSDLRERSIHLLAYISQGTQRVGESAGRIPPLSCPPVSKEEVDLNSKPSVIKSQNGWFALCPLGSASKPQSSILSSTSTALAVKDPSLGSTNQTQFSDMTAIQLYRIAFLVLKFLCLQAQGAAKRAEEMGFVDLAHFPELPMPNILHRLQDQVIVIVNELCKGSRSIQLQADTQNLCLLLLKIMEMAMYLELCVSQICGIQPVLGRVEDFSKEIKSLLKAAEDHSFLSSSINELKQIISLAYPEVLQAKNYMQLF